MLRHTTSVIRIENIKSLWKNIGTYLQNTAKLFKVIKKTHFFKYTWQLLPSKDPWNEDSVKIMSIIFEHVHQFKDSFFFAEFSTFAVSLQSHVKGSVATGKVSIKFDFFVEFYRCLLKKIYLYSEKGIKRKLKYCRIYLIRTILKSFCCSSKNSLWVNLSFL